MKKLIFICRGNKFRSQVAEALFNQNSIPDWKAFSYGTAVKSEGWQDMKLSQFGGGIQVIIDEMKKLGMNIFDKQCKQILPEYLEDAHKVIVMSEIDSIPEWLKARNYERWEIPNPEIIPEDKGESIIALLSEKIDALKKTL